MRIEPVARVPDQSRERSWVDQTKRLVTEMAEYDRQLIVMTLRAKKAEALLRKLEWSEPEFSEGESEYRCPSCGAERAWTVGTDSGGGVHEPDCELAAVLKAIE